MRHLVTDEAICCAGGVITSGTWLAWRKLPVILSRSAALLLLLLLAGAAVGAMAALAYTLFWGIG